MRREYGKSEECKCHIEYEVEGGRLLDFIRRSPSPFHVVSNIKERLLEKGFQELKEHELWDMTEGGNYFVTRNESSLMAFRIPGKDFQGFQIIASHSDSPSFKIKENASMESEKRYTKLNVERYGGMLCAPWFDRPLSVAGRIMVRQEGKICSKLVNIDRDLLLIPSLAIHMNREANEGYKYNIQTDLLPLLGDERAKDRFMELVAEEAGVRPEDIIADDLFLYNRQAGTIWGANKEYLSSPKLDDLECVWTSLEGFVRSEGSENVCVFCTFDNEEVGSVTKQGAASTFLKDTLLRINWGMDRNEEQYYTALASSFMISADGAHAVHPNKGEKTDPVNRPYLNGGIVLKYSANQKYTTDAVSAAVMKTICEKAEIPVQVFVNRSDMAGGSTLGNLSNTQVAVNTADIGVAQLAMHSSYETSGVKDVRYLVRLAEEFYSSTISVDADGGYDIG